MKIEISPWVPNVLCLSILMAAMTFAKPAFNRSSSSLSLNQVMFGIALPLIIIIVPLSRRLIENAMKKWRSVRINHPDIALLSVFASGMWMSYAFAYMTFDYLGDMRAILLSVILFSYIFIWVGALVVAFFHKH